MYSHFKRHEIMRCQKRVASKDDTQHKENPLQSVLEAGGNNKSKSKSKSTKEYNHTIIPLARQEKSSHTASTLQTARESS